MNKEECRELAITSMEILKSEKKTIELVRWASLKDSRARKMTEYLKNNPSVSYADVNCEMGRIVADELCL